MTTRQTALLKAVATAGTQVVQASNAKQVAETLHFRYATACHLQTVSQSAYPCTGRTAFSHDC